MNRLPSPPAYKLRLAAGRSGAGRAMDIILDLVLLDMICCAHSFAERAFRAFSKVAARSAASRPHRFSVSRSADMPWFVVSYDITPETSHSDDRFEGDALRWGWDKYARVKETFKRLPRRTLIGEFQNFPAATSNFVEVCNRFAASDHHKLENIILTEIKDFTLLP